MRELKTERIQVKIEPTLKAMAQKKAEEQGRTLSNYICELIKQDIGSIKIYVASTETGDFIEEVDTLEEGKALIEEFEQGDKEEGVYTEGFYNIVNESHGTVWSK